MRQTSQTNDITLALSGGAVRAVAHIGVIKLLKERGIEIVAVSGSSAGALVGYLLASGMCIDDMLKFMKSISKRDIFALAIGKPGLFTLERLYEKFAKLGLAQSQEDLSIPLYCAVSDIKSAEVRYLSSGNPLQNAIASSALSPIFSPIEIDDRVYIDGGFRDNLPTQPLLKYSKPIIGVDVNSMPKSEVKGFLSLTLHTVMVMLRGTALPSSKLCDCYMKIESVADVQLFDISKMDEIVESGYKEAKDRFKEIEDAIR